MKDINGQISYNGKEIPMVFNLNVMEKIQDEYGSLNAWADMTDARQKEPNAKAVIFGVTEMINEGIDIQNDLNGTNEPFYTRKQVGRIITEYGLAKVTQTLNQTVIESTQANEKNA